MFFNIGALHTWPSGQSRPPRRVETEAAATTNARALPRRAILHPGVRYWLETKLMGTFAWMHPPFGAGNAALR